MKQTKERDSNFELLRIVAMMLVLLVHANYFSLGDVTRDEIISTPWTAFVRMFCEHLCIVSVNLFVLISGWFGIRPTAKKVASLLFQVLFIGGVVVVACKCADVTIRFAEIRRLLFFGSNYWFVPSYLILFAISPMLNMFCEHASKRDFATLLISYFVLEALFGWITDDYGHYIGGYSALSFIGLYLLAQYIRRYGVERFKSWKWWHFLLIYLLLVTLNSVLAYILLYVKGRAYWAIMYSSMFVIASSVSLLLLFSKLHFKSNFINWIASSAFAIYLFHMAPGAITLYGKFFKGAYEAMPGILFIPFAIIAAMLIGLCAVLLDKVRIAAWNKLEVANKLINNNLRQRWGGVK